MPLRMRRSLQIVMWLQQSCFRGLVKHEDMNKDQMKALLIRDKEFLKSLYDSKSSPNAKNILKFASDSKLNTLLKFIHLVCTGEIKIRKDDFKVLEKKHLKVVEKYFSEKESTFLSQACAPMVVKILFVRRKTLLSNF